MANWKKIIVSGSQAELQSLSTDTDATVNTLTVGRGSGNIYSNTALGNQALFNNTTGCFNTAVGYQSLPANTSGRYNTAIGHQALLANTTGGFNTTVGKSSLQGNTTGCYNTALGMYALRCNTTGKQNTAIGPNTLYDNTTGGDNTALGRQALQRNTTGGCNTALGSFALQSNTTGNNNTAVGDAALLYATGEKNIAVGKYALLNITTGQSNVGLGAYEASNKPTESGNIFISDGDGNLRLYFTGSDGGAYFNSQVSASAFVGDGSGLTGLAVDLEVSGSTGNGSVNLLTGALSVIGTDSISTVATDSGDDLSVNISIRDASTTQKGAAQFNSDDFSVASGVVSLADTGSGAVLAVQGTANEIEVSRTNGTVTVGLPNSVNISENLTVGGNLTIQGTVTEIQTTNLLVEDRYILLNSGSVGDVDKGGIIVDSGGGIGKAFILGEASGRWGFTGSLAHDSSTATPDAFAAAVVTSEIAEYEKVGNIRVNVGTGEIFIYS